MIRFTSALIFALTIFTAQAQTTVAWLTNATGLPSLPPTSSRQAVSVGNESSGWSQWNWNAASTASTNSTVVAYTGLATGRWIQSPITGSASGLLTTGNATAALGIANKQMVDAVGTIVTNNAAAGLAATNGVAVNLTTATVPTTGNAVVNKDALDAATAGIATNAPIQVATIAALKTYASSPAAVVSGQQFIVGGYTANGDGGGGSFWFDPSDTISADNGGAVIVSTSGGLRFKRIFSGPVSPLQFGAVGYAGQFKIPYYSETNTAALTDFSVWTRSIWPTFATTIGYGSFRLGLQDGSWNRAVEIYGASTFFTVGIRGTNASFSPTVTSDDAGYLIWAPNPFLGLAGTTNDMVLTRNGTNWNFYVNGTNYTSTATWANRPGAAAAVAGGNATLFSVGRTSSSQYWNGPTFRSSLWDRVLTSGEIAAPSAAMGAIAQMTNSVGTYADSGSSIQSAIDYVSGLGGGEVRFPAMSFFSSREIHAKYGVELAGVPSDYSEYSSLIVSGSRIVNLFNSTNRAVVLATSSDLGSSPYLLNPTTWPDGTYAFNRELQGKISGMWFDAYNNGDALWFDKVACVKASKLTLTTTVGYVLRVDSGNVMEFSSLAFYSSGYSRPIRLYQTADFALKDSSGGGTDGQILLGTGANKNTISGNLLFNAAVSRDSWTPTVSTNTSLFTRAANRMLLGQAIWFEGDSGGTPPAPFNTATTPITNGITAYWGPYFAVPVSYNTFGVNTRYSTNSVGSPAAMQGTYSTVTSVGSGTWRISTGPEANLSIWNSSGNTIIGNRMDQSYRNGIQSFNGYGNIITGNNLAEAGFNGPTTASGVLLVTERNSSVSGNTLGKIRSGSNGDYGVTLATVSTNVAVGANNYTSLTYPVSVSSDSSLASNNASSVTNASGDSVLQLLTVGRPTASTNGFLYAPEMVGNPSGVPNAYEGNRAIIPIPSSRRIYTHSGSAWLYSMLANAGSTNTVDLSSENVFNFSNGSSAAITTSGTAIQAALVTSGNETITLQASSEGSGSSPSVAGYRTRGTVLAPTQVTDGYELLDLVSNARDNVGGYQFNLARIRAVATDDVTSTAKGAAWEFRTTLDGGTSEGARMYIGGSNGAVQISPSGATTPAASAALDVSSTTLGFLPPRMTTAQRDAIFSPAEGLVLFNTTTSKLQTRAGAAWADLNISTLPIGSVTGLGTGVATALGVNVGSAGAPVVNGGALGTPSSGTLTSATGLPISTGITGLGTGVATALGVNIGSAGAPVVNGGALGTPSSGSLANATGLPISTGVSGLGTGVATWLATPSSANLATALTDETGTGGGFVRATSPTLVTPVLGAASATTIVVTSGSGSYPITATGQTVSFNELQDGFSDTAGNNPGTLFQRARGTAAAPTGVLASDKIFLLTGAGKNSAGGYNFNTGYIQLQAGENFTGTAGGGIMDFAVTPAGTVSSVVGMRMNGSTVATLVPATFSSTITSSVATGTAPLTVASTTRVPNLNADLIDGLQKTGIQPANANLTNVAALTVQSLPSTIISVTENTQTGTTYTVLSTDNGKVVTLNNASAITVTVPTLSAGFSCSFIQKGAGQVTFTASGTTVSNAHSQIKTFGKYAVVTLYGLSSTTFVLAGDTGT
jgi:hypothetical protein